MSFDKLKGKMAEAHVSQDKLSKQLGITVQSLNAKINGRSQFTLEEIVKITDYLNLEDPVNKLQGLCFQVLRFLEKNPEIATEVIITDHDMRSTLDRE